MIVNASSKLKARSFSVLASVPMGPPDPILGLTEAFNNDKDPRKVSYFHFLYVYDALLVMVHQKRKKKNHHDVFECMRDDSSSSDANAMIILPYDGS